MIPPVCYVAALPLLLFGLLLELDIVQRSDLSVAILMFCEAAAIVVTVRALAHRYRPKR